MNDVIMVKGRIDDSYEIHHHIIKVCNIEVIYSNEIATYIATNNELITTEEPVEVIRNRVKQKKKEIKSLEDEKYEGVTI